MWKGHRVKGGGYGAYTVQEEIIRDFSEGTSVKCERSDCVELKKTERNKFKAAHPGLPIHRLYSLESCEDQMKPDRAWCQTDRSIHA
ncbi:hypothetical protein Y1Q_0024057 [Alligator mississippiensis]|uniref:Uncharacterized protein n=1 Tax=Alligator mississippiensis TaxID=8496 RepID=A0A151NHN2_ALLMI|nr:hypothetical protein Y1Q_0024057 [Alligator mississippiensis]